MKNRTLALAALLAIACLQAPVHASTPAIEGQPQAFSPSAASVQWETFVASRPELQPPPAHLSRLLFYRPVSSADPKTPADVFVNDRFLAALLPGGYAQLLVCPGPLRADLRGHATSGKDSIYSPTTITARGGQTHIIETHSKQHRLPLREIPVSQGIPELGRLMRQAHAISRQPSADNCPAPVQQASAPAPAPVKTAAAPKRKPQRYTLSSELLFRFGGAKVQDLTSVGHKEVVKLARAIRQRHRSIERVLVVGHTDPLGDNSLNQRLSWQRAQTIRQILVDSGLQAHVVNAQGVGSSQLIVKDCHRQAKKKNDLYACNQPNRRVEVLVTGDPR